MVDQQSIDFVDHSLSKDQLKRYRRGTTKEILDCHLSGGRILNALDFPMGKADNTPQYISSDEVAFFQAEDNQRRSYPVAEMRWGIAATAGSYHTWHIDSDGFGTYINVVAGYKWWVLAKPKESKHHFDEIDLYLKNYDAELTNDTKWDTEGILLLPGSLL